MFRIIPLILFAVLIGSNNHVHAQQVPLNIAIVNFEKVLRTANSMTNIREQVLQRRESYKTEVQKEEAGLRKANEELVQKQNLLTPEAFQAERRKFEENVQNVQRQIQQKNQGIQQAQSKAQKRVQDELRTIILEISQQRGYTLVLRHSQTVIVADQFDITDVVISELNKRLPTIKVF